MALLLALITLVAYLPAARNSFVDFDDDDYVTNNQFVQNGLTWVGIKWAFTTWHASNWHPLTWLSHMTDCELFGLNAGAQHYVNVLFHTASAVLLLLLLYRLTGALWPSAFVAALFAWHPLHVESIAWIAERKDVLSTFFEMLALLAYARAVTRGQRQVTGTASSLSRVTCPPAEALAKAGCGSPFYWLALFLFALGLMAKPMLVTLPFLLLLLDYWPLQRFPDFKLGISTVSRLALEKWPFFLLATASCLVTFFAQHNGGLVITLQQLPLDARLGNAFLSYARYLGKTVWPVKLAIVYPLQNQFPWTQAAAAAVFLMVITWFAWRGCRRWPYLLVGWFWFLGTLIPVIGLVQTGGQAMADRYTYVPLIGIFIAVTFGIKDLITRFRMGIVIPAVAGSLILGNCLFLTERQLSYWRDSESLFRHAVAATRDNDVAYYCLGLALAEQGKLDEALVEYRQAERLAPDRFQTHRNIGNLLDEKGNPDEALVEYCEAVRLNPKNPLLYDRLGFVLARLGRFNEAMNQYEQALRLDPGDPRPFYLMGRALLKQGRSMEAIDKFRQLLRLNPNDLPTLLFLARTFASDNNPEIRNGVEAIALAEKANDLTGGEQPFVLDTLAIAYAEAGRFPDARQIEQRAIRLAQAAGLEETNAMFQRLELYRVGQPYRETFTNTPPQNLPNN
jgi:tetratricopeptide (TPR) repeat protein